MFLAGHTMTVAGDRDEQRAACIEAMKAAFKQKLPPHFPTIPLFETCMTSALDALHGFARVNSVEATEEDVERVAQALARRKTHDTWTKMPSGYWQTQARVAIGAMSAVSDLTNPPEGKT